MCVCMQRLIMAIISLSLLLLLFFGLVYNDNRSMEFMPEMCITVRSRIDSSCNLWSMFAVVSAFVLIHLSPCAPLSVTICLSLGVSVCVYIFMKPRSTNILLHI